MAVGLSVRRSVPLSVETDVSSVWVRANTVCYTAGLSSIFIGAWLVLVCVKAVWERTSVSIKLSVLDIEAYVLEDSQEVWRNSTRTIQVIYHTSKLLIYFFECTDVRQGEIKFIKRANSFADVIEQIKKTTFIWHLSIIQVLSGALINICFVLALVFPQSDPCFSW